jgi:PKD repeat protein
MTTKQFVLLTTGLFSAAILSAQIPASDNWQQQRMIPGTNFYIIQHAFDSVWGGREAEMLRERGQMQNRNAGEREELDGTWFHYKRWEWFTEPRVAPSGDISLPSTTYLRFQDYLNTNAAAQAQYYASVMRSASTTPSWSFVGPIGAPSFGGAGRINCVRFDGTNTNVIYAGAPAGGLWKTTDGGQNWNCLTDFQARIGCSDVAIDPTNTNVLYLATGDNDGGDTYSIGILKSTDGGVTWAQTGLVFAPSQTRRIARVLIDPTNTNIVYAATSVGIYKTTNAGTTWLQVSQFGAKDMEMKPGDPNTIYIAGTRFYVTTNGGANWTQVTTGLPQANIVSRMAIAVTPADPAVVYVLAGATGSNGFEGIYRSDNSGQSFVNRASSPNLLGWDPSGGDTDGQAWYDLAIAASPVDEDIVYTGGVNIWRSDDGGVSWNLNGHWYGGGGVPYVHADIHDLVFVPGTLGTVYSGNDGGVFFTNDGGGNWSDLSANMGIAQIYRLGISASNSGILITGHQDNGTNLKNGSNYEEVLGGDGMDCFIDRTDNNVMYGSIYYGDFYRSTNGGNNFNGITNGLIGSGGWVTPWIQDPVQPDVLYAGYGQMFKTNNRGNNWFQLGNMPNSADLTDIQVAPSNTLYLYATNGNLIFRSTDGGQNWQNVTGNLITGGISISRIIVDPHNEKRIWLTLSGYVAANKVVVSTDAGTTYTNISTGLPNLPATCGIAVPGAGNGLVFIGCDVGVYYRTDNTASWMPYFTGLPHAPVSDMSVFEPTQTLRISTYGRGVWECAIDPSLLVPLANFSVNSQQICVNTAAVFTDLSTHAPTSWSWSFPGGTPSSSTAQNPSITYAAPGVYAVTLTAGNAAGSATTTRTSYIVVSGAQPLPYSEDFVSAAFMPAGITAVNGGNPSLFWARSTSGNNNAGSAVFYNYNSNSQGDQDMLQLPGFNLNAVTSPQLSFDVAYARYSSSRSDTLEVLVSTDCGASWTQVFIKGGNTLSTASQQTSAFVPTAAQWRNEVISLNSYAGNSSVMIRFRNRGRNGNNLYIDNINLNGTATAAPVAAFTAQTACAGSPVQFADASAPAATSYSWMFTGGNPATATTQQAAATWNTPGTYTVELIATNSFGSDTVQQTITVLSNPAITTSADTAVCDNSAIQLSATGGTVYSWSPGAGLSDSTVAMPSLVLANTTTFIVTVTDGQGCSATDTVTATALALPAFTLNTTQSICVGDSIVLAASNPAHSYNWQPTQLLQPFAADDSVLIFPTYTTTFTVTATDASGCVTTTTRPVTVYPPLLTPIILVNGFTLTSSVSAQFYQWYLNGVAIAGATSQTYQATTVGSYTLITSNTLGCSSDESQPVLVNGIAEAAPRFFNLQPNPNNGVFELLFDVDAQDDYVLSIFSADGKRVYEEQLGAFSGRYRNVIDLTATGSGTYMIRLTGKQTQTMRQVVVF